MSIHMHRHIVQVEAAVRREVSQTKRDVRRCRANVKRHGGDGFDDVADAELDCTERHLASLQRILAAIDGAP